MSNGKVTPGKVVAVVLAGGYGTRVRHLLPNLPKPMALVAGKPFLEWVVRYLGTQGIPNVILSTGYLGEVVERHFQTQPVPSVRVWCCAETEPLGTAGGFRHAVRRSLELHLPSPPTAWLVLNGDSLAFAPLASLLRHLDNPKVAGAILGLSVEDASRYGSLACDSQGNLLQFAEKRPGCGTINAGVYLLRHAVLEALPISFPLSFEQDVFPDLLTRETNFKVEICEAPFLDIGTPESLPQAEVFIEKNRDWFNDFSQ
ncbi:nucleotidyltransferase family protein [Lusitaniella coriacea LEGE 07157]|uniref:Nucleotidyltransferase family protein n=1 Tax=Lusitaniella coriacea LEGE 07157 TaxID=945747 RepID=A0A8J7DZ97_9CYAN|nr:nucleotidyltransferase family protein [Lusitaniella coriacea]MBE9117183.1 nucleotidyltransferase family protein [Lusitaniella coriacea LEGE 07157]